MVGAPGAGKGTQASLLGERLGLAHVASGDLFRDHISRETALGKKVKAFLDRGALVPDDLPCSIIADRLSETDASQGRDPRRLSAHPRAGRDARQDALAARAAVSTAALYIDVDRDEVVQPLVGALDLLTLVRPRLPRDRPPAASARPVRHR